MSDFPSDHFIIDFLIRQKFTKAKPVSRIVYDFKNGDFEGLRNALNRVPFDMALLDDDINSCWLKWRDLFLATVDEFIPKKKIKDVNSPPWIDGEVRYLLKKKYSALKKYRLNKTEARKLKLRHLSQNVKNLIKFKRQQYLTKIKSSLSDNPKLFWSFHKAILHHRSTPSVITYNGITAKTPKEKADLFNLYFASIFQPRDILNSSSSCSLIRNTNQISDISITHVEVANYLQNLDVTKAGGPDAISPRLLKLCSNEIAKSLSDLFNKSLQLGLVPLDWKKADVIPLHKDDDKEPADNHRPISLLPVVGKVMERCVFDHFYSFVLNFLSDLQHGFIKNRSCVTQLLQILHEIGRNLDNNIQTDVMYLDFAKAFDTVDHGILLSKLTAYGVSGNLFSWFKDYLNGRLQRVVKGRCIRLVSHHLRGSSRGSVC